MPSLITALPTPPSRADAVNFATRADAFLGALPTFRNETNTLANELNGYNNSASDSATAAQASANSAAMASGVTAWVSGTTYAVGACRYSPSNFYTYRRKTAGAGTTDPASDGTNWVLLTGFGNVDLTSNQSLSNKHVLTDMGIGTSSPVVRLHMHEPTVSLPVYLKLTNANTGTTLSDGFDIAVGPSSECYIWNRENSEIRIATNNLERLRIAADGKIGIGGVVSASNTLRVSGGLEMGSTSDYVYANNFGAVSGTIPMSFLSNNQFVWKNTLGSEFVRIDTSGNLLVGVSSKLTGGISGLDLNSPVSSGGGITYGILGTTKAFTYTSATTSRLQFETVSGWGIACIAGGTNGVALASAGTSWASLSDIRKKDIIEPITGAVEKINTLRSVIGKYKNEAEGTRRVFLIAQDVEAVLPEAVVQSGEDLLLQYTDVIPLLVSAIKELSATNAALITRIEALENK